MFQPSESGTYQFYSTGSAYPSAFLYEGTNFSSDATIAYDNDAGSESNFDFSHYLEAGKTYYCAVQSSSGWNHCTVHLTMPFAAKETYSRVACAPNGEVTLTPEVSGGEKPYTYTWYEGDSVDPLEETGSTLVVTADSAKNYRCMVA
ncbi:MAG: hypothetical protein IIY88_01630, partial [Eubacterium sp.]|nr:hypothetical protein [Eubacterium sp.]